MSQVYEITTLAALEAAGRAKRTFKWPGRFVRYASGPYTATVAHPTGAGAENGYHAQDKFVWELDDAVVHQGGGLVTVGNAAVAETIDDNHLGFERISPQHVRAQAPTQIAKTMREAATLVADGAYNLYHFLFGVVAREGLLDGIKAPRLVPKLTTQVQKDLLRYAHVQPTELQGSTRVAHLYLPDHVGAFGALWHHPYARRLYKRMQAAARVVTVPHSNVFLGRPTAQRRRLENETELADALRVQGFACFDFAAPHLSAKDQMQIFAGAERIVGLHGAGMAWLAFCEPSTAVLELLPTTYANWCMRRVAEIGRLTYRAHLAPDATSETVPHDITWRVPVEEISAQAAVLTADHYAHKIHGFFNFEDLYEELVATAPLGSAIVEIGSWKGASTAFLGMEAKRTGRTDLGLFAVDTWRGTENEPGLVADAAAHGGSIRHVFDATMARGGLERLVTAIEGDSAESAQRFADKSVWAAFIDADHSYAGCLRDIDAWLPKIVSGGLLTGHDIPHPPVEEAVRKRFGDRFERRGSCWIVRVES